jgi:nucleoside-diphosphate-sugar epimerase
MGKNEPSYENVLGRSLRAGTFSSAEVESLRSERILLTGAGGSIGSRIAIGLAQIGGVHFLNTDRDESALHSLSLKLTSTALFEGQNFLLLDIRDKEGSLEIAKEFKPTVIIHAAALKHLSVLEKQPREALLTNIYGTLNLLEIAEEIGVHRFINISTDKAASPVSVLGKSKYLAELLTTRFKKSLDRGYTSVRFGNVYGSRGSVIETFTDQISRGMPVTITNPDVTRYFMHPDEAAYLTIKSMFIELGDVHLFNMGEPVLITEIVSRLVAILGGHNNIIFTGLREGEKVAEDLFDGVENRVVAIPDLIESGDHNIALRKNLALVEKAISRDSVGLLDYLRGTTAP